MTPAIGSRWRNIGTGMGAVLVFVREHENKAVLRLDGYRTLHTVALTKDGRPCGYEPAGDEKEGEG